MYDEPALTVSRAVKSITENPGAVSLENQKCLLSVEDISPYGTDHCG